MSQDLQRAQEIVARYARALEGDLNNSRLPAPLESLPFSKSDIKAAIEASAVAIASSGQMTSEVREWLETAYVSLADYVPADLARLLGHYRTAADRLPATARTVRERTDSPDWSTLVEASRLTGDVARSIAEEADQLRHEFRRLV